MDGFLKLVLIGIGLRFLFKTPAASTGAPLGQRAQKLVGLIEKGPNGQDSSMFAQLLRSEISEQERAVLIFSASWCGHCTKMKKKRVPEKIAQALRSEKIPVFLIDASEQAVGMAFDVNSFPAIKFYRGGTERGTFTGEKRDPAEVAKQARRALP